MFALLPSGCLGVEAMWMAGKVGGGAGPSLNSLLCPGSASTNPHGGCCSKLRHRPIEPQDYHLQQASHSVSMSSNSTATEKLLFIFGPWCSIHVSVCQNVLYSKGRDSIQSLRELAKVLKLKTALYYIN